MSWLRALFGTTRTNVDGPLTALVVLKYYPIILGLMIIRLDNKDLNH